MKKKILPNEFLEDSIGYYLHNINKKEYYLFFVIVVLAILFFFTLSFYKFEINEDKKYISQIKNKEINILSPLDGIIESVNFDRFSNIRVGDTLLTIISIDKSIIYNVISPFSGRIEMQNELCKGCSVFYKQKILSINTNDNLGLTLIVENRDFDIEVNEEIKIYKENSFITGIVKSKKRRKQNEGIEIIIYSKSNDSLKQLFGNYEISKNSPLKVNFFDFLTRKK